MGKIEKIIKKGSVEGQTTEVYPVTSTKAVYDENNKRLDNIITGLKESVYLNTPIPISTDNTPESIAQNVKNISDYIEKAKAAGIADVNGIGVTCLIDDYFSGVGYIFGNTNVSIQGIKIPDDIVNNAVFTIFNGRYDERFIVGVDELDKVTSNMLVQGARKPIILTPDTTEVDEKTYQKLLKDNVDVLLKDASGNVYRLTTKDEDDTTLYLYFTCITLQGTPTQDIHIFGFNATITKNSPHTCSIDANFNDSITVYLDDAGYLNKSTLFPVLKEIDLTGTDADRKAKLYEFERDWKALTGASDLFGARFVGIVYNDDIGTVIRCLFSCDPDTGLYSGISAKMIGNDVVTKISVSMNGSLIITPLFSHLEAITISIDNTPESKAANVAAIEAYEDNLVALGFDTTKGYMIPITVSGRNGFLSTRSGNYPYVGYVSADSSVNDFYNILILENGEYYDSKIQPENSGELNTISKKLVPAINEVNTLANNKQDKTDNTLATTDKTISGAINEINTKVSNLTGALTWKGKFDTLPAVTDYKAGNVIGVGNKEYVLTVTGSTKAWEELGDEGSYLLKSTAEETYAKKTSIPTVNNPKVSIKMNGAEKGSFTLNQASAGEVDLGTVITAHQDISGKVDKTLNAKAFEGITILISNTAEAMNANKAAVQAYVNNLTELGVDITKGFNVPVRIAADDDFCGCLTGEYHTGQGYFLSGTIFSIAWGAYYIKDICITPDGQYMELVNIKNDNGLNTTSKNLIGAINEVNTLAKNKQDKLTSGTNIKTINNQSLLGSGNIEISAPSITVDTSMSDTSMNPVQNKVIKAYIDGLVGNVAAQLAQI